MNGAILRQPPNAEDQRPVWLAVQVRRGEKILGEPYYLPLRDLKAEPVTEPTIPAATAADYEQFLKRPSAAASNAADGKGKKRTPTPGG